MKKPHSIFLLVLLPALAAFSTPATAQNEGRWYQVEVLIFKRLNPDASLANSEQWPQDITLSYPENSRYLPKTLPSNAHQLGGYNYTLRRDESYRVLFHKAWRQQMWGKAKSPALIIQGGRNIGNHKELEGTVTIHIGRYLHVSTDLWLSQLGSTTTSSFILPDLPQQANNSLASFASDNPQGLEVITFREKRRMRSKETHYIDHPYLGMIVRMLPLD